MLKTLKLGTATLFVLAATAAPVTVRVSPATLAGAEPLVQLTRACGQEARIGSNEAGEAEARGCTVDITQICETSHSDYRYYRNNN